MRAAQSIKHLAVGARARHPACPGRRNPLWQLALVALVAEDDCLSISSALSTRSFEMMLIKSMNGTAPIPHWPAKPCHTTQSSMLGEWVREGGVHLSYQKLVTKQAGLAVVGAC